MYGSGLGLCFLAYFRLRNCRPRLASRKCLPPRLKEKKLGFFSIYLGLFPFGSVFNQVSISRLYISPTVRCTDSRWKLELNTLPKVKSLDKFKKTPLFFSQALEKHCTSCLERGKYNFQSLCFAIVIFWGAGYLAVAGMNLLHHQISDRVSPGSV